MAVKSLVAGLLGPKTGVTRKKFNNFTWRLGSFAGTP